MTTAPLSDSGNMEERRRHLAPASQRRRGRKSFSRHDNVFKARGKSGREREEKRRKSAEDEGTGFQGAKHPGQCWYGRCGRLLHGGGGA